MSGSRAKALRKTAHTEYMNKLKEKKMRLVSFKRFFRLVKKNYSLYKGRLKWVVTCGKCKTDSKVITYKKPKTIYCIPCKERITVT